MKKAYKHPQKTEVLRKPKASSRDVPTSSQTAYDTQPQSVRRRHIALNAKEMESQKPRLARDDLSYS